MGVSDSTTGGKETFGGKTIQECANYCKLSQCHAFEYGEPEGWNQKMCAVYTDGTISGNQQEPNVILCFPGKRFLKGEKHTQKHILIQGGGR